MDYNSTFSYPETVLYAQTRTRNAYFGWVDQKNVRVDEIAKGLIL